MRKGNKSKLLIAVLAFALALNAFCFAGMASEGFEVVLDFEEVPGDNEIAAAEELVPMEEEVFAVEEIPAEEETPAEEEEAVVMASAASENGGISLEADSTGQDISPESIFVYNGSLYKVTGKVNIVSAGGGFDTKPSILPSGTSSDTKDSFINSVDGAVEYDSTEGHTDPGCLKWSNGVLIWRHAFETGKLYVYSVWYKFTGTADLYDSQRQLAGANDVAGGTHYNTLTNDGTETWQQDWCVFKGDSSEYKFLYAQLTGSGTIYIDDFYIYEVEEYTESLSVDSHFLERQSDMQIFDVPSEGIPSAGEYYHVINYTNVNVVEYPVTGVVALMKDGKLVKIFASSTRTVRGRLDGTTIKPASGTIDIWFEIPELGEGEDISQYSYIAYVVNEGNPFGILGSPSEKNAAVVYGNGAAN